LRFFWFSTGKLLAALASLGSLFLWRSIRVKLVNWNARVLFQDGVGLQLAIG